MNYYFLKKQIIEIYINLKILIPEETSKISFYIKNEKYYDQEDNHSTEI